MIRFLHSRYSALAAAIAATAFAIIAWCLAAGQLQPGTPIAGMVAGWTLAPAAATPLTAALAVAANMATALLLMQMAKQFNVLRCSSMLHGALFLCMQAATPALLCVPGPGILLALCMMCCFCLMFSAYGRVADCQRRVFLAFCLLSAFSAADAAFVVFVPVLWLGCIQMRVFNFRTLLASFMGLAVPWIIILGFGLAHGRAITMPHTALLAAFRGQGSSAGIAGVAIFTAVLGTIAWTQNIMKFLAYNASSRAMLSMLTITMLTCAAAIIAAPQAAACFTPLLNGMAAMQLAHVFGVMFTGKRSAWAILSIIAIYLGIAAWKLATL